MPRLNHLDWHWKVWDFEIKFSNQNLTQISNANQDQQKCSKSMILAYLKVVASHNSAGKLIGGTFHTLNWCIVAGFESHRA